MTYSGPTNLGRSLDCRWPNRRSSNPDRGVSPIAGARATKLNSGNQPGAEACITALRHQGETQPKETLTLGSDGDAVADDEFRGRV